MSLTPVKKWWIGEENHQEVHTTTGVIGPRMRWKGEDWSFAHGFSYSMLIQLVDATTDIAQIEICHKNKT